MKAPATTRPAAWCCARWRLRRRPLRETVRIERLAALGKLWAAVKYFHPWLAYQDIDWDARPGRRAA